MSSSANEMKGQRAKLVCNILGGVYKYMIKIRDIVGISLLY